MRRAFVTGLIIAASLCGAGSAAAEEKLKFDVKSPKWGKVSFTFNGTKACATNQGERMCGTANKVPKPGEAFNMSWAWPQKAWTRP